MRYERPEIVTLVNASVAIQAHIKDHSPFFDVLPEETIGAYEADE